MVAESNIKPTGAEVPQTFIKLRSCVAATPHRTGAPTRAYLTQTHTVPSTALPTDTR